MALDASNMKKDMSEFAQQCREALLLPRGVRVTGTVNHIVICGMGGSAIGGDLVKMYLHDSQIPVTVVRDYNIPAFVTDETLVFIVSYSGNTEETLSCLEQAEQKKAQIIAVTTGGKVGERAENVVNIPTGLQPRVALAYVFFPLLGILHNSEVTRVKNDDINEMLELLKDWESVSESGEALAKKVKGKLPIIYSSDYFSPVGYRWKTQLNENGKVPAYSNVFSEMNHNEIAGVPGMTRDLVAVFIKDSADHERHKKRMDICQEIMEERLDVHVVDTRGKSLLARMFSTIFLGDWMSYHVALYNRVDPTPVDVIEGLKKKLDE